MVPEVEGVHIAVQMLLPLPDKDMPVGFQVPAEIQVPVEEAEPEELVGTDLQRMVV